MELVENRRLDFSWASRYELGEARQDLVTILVCYDQLSHNEGSMSVAERADGKFSYSIKYPKDTQFADVYITMISNDREQAANSV